MTQKCSYTVTVAKSNWSLLGLSNKVICILVAEGASKLPDFKIGGKKNPGLELRPHSSGADRAEWQNFFSDPQL